MEGMISINLLILGPERKKFNDYFKNSGEKISYFEGKLDPESEFLNSIDVIISYGYRYIIKEELINKFQNRILNLHISYLPWNRGADPNLWSFLKDTPKGVTIHYIDSDIDTGDIILQKKIEIYNHDTLKTTYNRLSNAIEDLLIENWNNIRIGNITPRPQNKNLGSFHKKNDKQKYTYLLTKAWDTPVNNIIGVANKREDCSNERH
ncbi:formyltransferase family protein [Virgibacillus sp. JSM 102003]|uniref:formyltransferase family protein n=1 Tax=Virgibacillus sp. JSM 102003 TaxID=1562108 RepID=UPI0035C10F8E